MISELIVAYILAKNYSPPIVCGIDKPCPTQPKYTVPIVCKMGKCPTRPKGK